MTSTKLCFQTIGGAQSATVHAGADAAMPVVVIAPALGIRASYYDKLCLRLATRGLGAVAIDAPGHGSSPIRAQRGVEWGYAEFVAHLEAACIAAHQQWPQAPILLLGHSIGGQIGLMLAGRNVPGLRGVVLVASGTPYWRAWSGTAAWRLLAGTTLCATVASAMGYFPGHRLGFGGREARRLIVEWATVSRNGCYTFDGFDGEHLLAQPGPPIRAIGMQGDDYAPEAAIRHALDKVTARDVCYETWTDPPHNGNHNRWPNAPEHIVDRVVSFADALAA